MDTSDAEDEKDDLPGGDLLRATTWTDYIGQDRLKARLRMHIDAALNDGPRMLDHVLLEAPPGYGKTTLGALMAEQMFIDYAVVKWPMKARPFTQFLRTWGGGVVLLDELHRGSKSGQESLLPLLEEGYYADDSGRRTYVPYTCFVGATTEPDKLIQPLRDRFPIRPRFADYTDEEMGRIVQGMAGKVELSFDDPTAVQLGRACGGTPRVARELMLYARDLVANGLEPTVERILDGCERDNDGLSADHVAYLMLMHELGGVGVGLKTLSTILRLPEATIRELERLLVKKGLLMFEASGRALSNAGFVKAKSKKG